MIRDVAESMHTFFVPQMEQIGLREQASRHGSLSALDSDLGSGILWAMSLSDDCLYTYNEVHPQADFSFMEFPQDSICISYMSRDSAKQIPLDGFARRKWKDRNILSFHMAANPMSCRITRDVHCCSHSIVLLSSYFERLEGFSDAERKQLFDFLSASDETTLPGELASLFSGLVPELSRRPGGNTYCAAKVNEILSAVIDAAFASAEEGGLAGTEDAGALPDAAGARSAEDRAVAREAKRIIDDRFDERLTTVRLSKELFVGRTHLCEAFRDEYHMGVGEYLRLRRMEEAARLLADERLSVSQVADAVGYAHASSFIEAFRRYYGMSPARARGAASRK